jgi:type I restriction enzyme M protein
MSEIINKEVIGNTVWKACDSFRGIIDPAQYKDYILIMLFVKYISDVWKDKREEYKKQFGDNTERIERRLERERFKLPEGCDFDTLFDKRDKANIGEIIDIALDNIENTNRELLAGVFGSISFNSDILGETKERNARLKHLLEDFNDPRLDLRPSKTDNSDIIGDAYEYLIQRFASNAGKKAGEFFTPAEVSELLAELVDPQPGDRICDPTCGSGSLLIKCAKQVGSTDFSIWGQEINASTWALSKMNMFLHEINNATIVRGDTIRNPLLVENDHLRRSDVVVANPPFSLDKWGYNEASTDRYKRFEYGLPPKSKGDYAFILHMLESADRQSGRVGVVLPHGVLFRGAAEGRIRKILIKENLLDAVIGLPANLFYGTGIPAVILLFKYNRKTNDILFIDASREVEKGTNQNVLSEDNIKKIVTTYRERKPQVDKYSYLAPFKEIRENDYNLNIPRYVDIFVEEEEIDIVEVQQEINTLESELADVQAQMKDYLKELELL